MCSYNDDGSDNEDDDAGVWLPKLHTVCTLQSSLHFSRFQHNLLLGKTCL